MPMKYRAISMAVVAAFFAGLLVAVSSAQDGKDEASIARMKKDVYFLASEECEGRGVGTLGLDLAAQYVAVQFSRAGLKPGGTNNSYFQPFPFATSSQLDGESTLVLEGPMDKRITLKQGTDFQVISTSAPGKRSAPLVFVGYGVSANGVAYDEYKGVDVKGKIVIALRRLPQWGMKEHPLTPNKDALGSLDAKQNRAEANEAAAIVLVNDHSELPNDKLMPFQAGGRLSTLSTPFVQIKRAVLDEILKQSIGKDVSETEKAIDADLKPRSTGLKGWTAHLDVKVKRKEIPVKNVVGVVEGSGELANETVVVGAHYDHLGYGAAGKDKKKPIYFGADDNGSGTTTMMELARRFAAKKMDGPTRRTVFMAFTAEESGLIGSRHYTQVAPLFALKDTVAMFNLDMVGRIKDTADGSKPKLLVEGFNTAKEFDDLVTKMNPGFDIVKKNTRGFFASDQYSFYVQKIPVVFFWTGEHPEYHKPTDVAEKINVAGMAKIADYAEAVIQDLRTNPKRPEYTPVNVKIGGGGPPSSGPSLRFQPDPFFDGKGVLIDKIVQGGPADKAGIKEGDVIIELAGREVTNVATYNTIRATLKAGTEIDIKILRDKKEMTLKITPVSLK